MDVTLKQLQIFQAVVVAGSITKASRRLSLSQPSISQQLAKLEELVGAQLILRNRTGIVSLTPAGEYWFNAGDEILRRLDVADSEYKARFVDQSVTLRIGMTPTLRGRFLSKAARIAFEEPGFVKFEMRYALTSTELAEQLKLHQLNCALINLNAISHDRASFAIAELFSDAMAFVVPASVSEAEIRRSLMARDGSLEGPLRHFIEVDGSSQLRAKTEHWYRYNLVGASATFMAMTYPAAMDICAEGLGTTHCPLSLVPNLPQTVLERIRIYKLRDFTRTVALVMPKHLLSLPAYARIFRRLEEFCRTDYQREMQPHYVKDFQDLITTPVLDGAALLDNSTGTTNRPVRTASAV